MTTITISKNNRFSSRLNNMQYIVSIDKVTIMAQKIEIDHIYMWIYINNMIIGAIDIWEDDNNIIFEHTC